MKIDDELLEVIQEIISGGNRCEIVPSPDGVEVYKASRKKWKPKSQYEDQFRNRRK